METGPIRVGEVFWRKNPSAYVDQRTGITGNTKTTSDTISISDEATVMSSLMQLTNSPGGETLNSNLLTDSEKDMFNKINDNYGDQSSGQVEGLAISLLTDKVMANSSGEQIPTLNQSYLLKIENELRDGSGSMLHSKIGLDFIANLLNDKFFL